MSPRHKSSTMPEAGMEQAVAAITGRWGDGAIMRFGARPHLIDDVLPSGIATLDAALGIGGFPRGRIVELYGRESSGKSTLCLAIVAAAQRQGGTCAYIDVEHALDPVWAKSLGVDVDNLWLSQPDSAEQALSIAEILVCSGEAAVVVVDSVAALTPQAEIDGDMGDAHVALQARLLGQAMRKLTSAVARTQTLLLFVNQIREKVGVLYGSPDTTPGGNALKFYASVRLDIRRVESIKDGAEITGNRTRVKVVKNKVAAPFKQAEFDIMYGKGISREGSLLDVAVDLGIVKKSGAWFTYEGEQLGQGRENAKTFLVNNSEVSSAIEEKVRAATTKAEELDTIGASHDEPEGTGALAGAGF